MGDPIGGPQPSGLYPEQAAAYAVSFAESRAVDRAQWDKAEQRTAELIAKIRGTRSTDERRKDVADYVGDLIRKCLKCQVYTFGSVPLKTYLPDGDIDLTIVSREPRLKDAWASVVRTALEKEERNLDGRFRVKEVQYINAEVKLIKCRVENIVVDISFNQFGGLCTLCFLEEVDRVIGKDHFFKRSIILIKAWCYYESALLGAHHGLISTYALETLVLYIFHVFHASLRGPLEVLLRFLEFFSKFDWQKYAVSVWGPVPLVSLPNMNAESPRQDGGELLLTKDFLDACLEDYAVFINGNDNSSGGRTFTAKYLNVVDPLRATNNLGRSVNQTNFNRIGEALGHSANKLLKILVGSEDIDSYFGDTKNSFFKRTKDRLDQFEEKRPDAVDEIAHSATWGSTGANQRGYGAKRLGENGDSDHPNRNLYKMPEAWTLESDVKNDRSSRISCSPAGHVFTLTSLTDTEAKHREGTSEDFLSGKDARNGASMVGETERNVKANGQTCGAGSVVKPSPTMEQRDMDFSMDDHTVRASLRNRSTYTQTDFGCIRASVGSIESSETESLQESETLLPDLSSETPLSVRSSSPIHTIDKEDLRQSGRGGDQTSCSGRLDSQRYVQQSSINRMPSSLPVSVVPHTQIPVTFSHHGQLPMPLATSLGASAAKGHMSKTGGGPPPPLSLHSVSHLNIVDSRTGLGPRTAACIALPLDRRTSAPPFFPGLPSGHQVAAVGEVPGALGRFLTPFPVPQGEDANFEHEQVWQQIEQIPVQNHQSKYGYVRPVSSVSAVVSRLPQHLNSESSFVVSSAPALISPGPFQLSSTLALPRTQGSMPINLKMPLNESTSAFNTPSVTAIGHQIVQDANQEISKSSLKTGEMGGSSVFVGPSPTQAVSELRVQSSKEPKPGKDKRTISKSTINEDDGDVETSEDAPQFSSAEGSGRWPSQGMDDVFQMGPGYSQVPVTAPTLSVSGRPRILSTPLSLQGSGLLGSEVSPYSIPHMVQTSKTAVASSPISSQPANRTLSLSAGIASAPSIVPGLSVSEFVNISSSFPTSHRQMPMESSPPPSSVYYPMPSQYPFLSVYNPTSRNQVYMYPPSPDPAFSGLEIFGGLHLSNLMDNYNDASKGQVDESHLKFTQRERFGVGERLRAKGVATCSLSRSEATEAFDAADPSVPSNDLLSSDLGNHLCNLDFARFCQNSSLPIQTPYGHQQYWNPTTKYYTDFQPWEGPGRPFTPNVNMPGNVMNYGLVHVSPSLSPSAHYAGNLSCPFSGTATYVGDDVPKAHVGTGTYLPNLRPPYIRDRSSGSGRNQHGGYNQERVDRGDCEVDQVHGPRFRGNGRGQGKYESHSQSGIAGIERSNIHMKGGDRGRDLPRHYDPPRKHQLQPGAGPPFTAPGLVSGHVAVMPQVTTCMVETYSVPSMLGQSKSTASPGTSGGVIPSYPPEKRLEFGSLGPVKVETSQGRVETDHRTGHIPRLQCHDQATHTRAGPPGLSLSWVDRNLQVPSSAEQSEQSFQHKEEDFPPLSHQLYVGSSSTGASSGSTTANQNPLFPAYVPASSR